MTAITYSDMPGELRDKLKLQETLNKINKLKTKSSTLINDVLGVEHSIDNIHNYEDTNLKEDL
jgi:hypothetical protein